MTFNPETLKGLTNVNNEVYFNKKVTFFGNVNLESVTLKGQLSSSGPVTFSDSVTFSDNVTFNSGVTATEVSVQNVNVGGAVTVSSLTVGGQLVDGDGNFGTSGQVLSSDGTGLEWINTSDANVGSASNVGVNLNATNANQWITFVGANSGNNPIRVDDGLRYNPSTNTISEVNFSGACTFNNVSISGQLRDGDGDFGTSGQVLASDGTNTNWVNAGSLSAGSAAEVSVTEVDTNATHFITFVDVSSGSDNIKVDDQFTYNASTNVLTAGSVSDVSGTIRNIPQNSQTRTYTLVASDTGKHISITTGGVIVPSGVFSIGDVVTIFNNSSSTQTVSAAAGVTLRQAGTTNTGTRTLLDFGLATVMCVASDVFTISGAGLI